MTDIKTNTSQWENNSFTVFFKQMALIIAIAAAESCSAKIHQFTRNSRSQHPTKLQSICLASAIDHELQQATWWVEWSKCAAVWITCTVQRQKWPPETILGPCSWGKWKLGNQWNQPWIDMMSMFHSQINSKSIWMGIGDLPASSDKWTATSWKA